MPRAQTFQRAAIKIILKSLHGSRLAYFNLNADTFRAEPGNAFNLRLMKWHFKARSLAGMRRPALDMQLLLSAPYNF